MANDLQTSADLNSCRCCSSDLNPPSYIEPRGYLDANAVNLRDRQAAYSEFPKIVQLIAERI